MIRVLLYEAGAIRPCADEAYDAMVQARLRARQWVTRAEAGRGTYKRERDASLGRTRYWTACGERCAYVFDAWEA